MRKRLAVTVAAFFLLAGVAAAYFLITSGSGSGTTTLGTASGSLTLHVINLPSGLVPGGSGTFDVTVDDSTANPGVVHSLTVGPFTTPACGDVSSSFQVTWPDGSTGTTYTPPSPVNIPANSQGTNAFNWTGPDGLLPTLTFVNGGDQSCLAGQTLTVNIASS